MSENLKINKFHNLKVWSFHLKQFKPSKTHPALLYVTNQFRAQDKQLWMECIC